MREEEMMEELCADFFWAGYNTLQEMGIHERILSGEVIQFDLYPKRINLDENAIESARAEGGRPIKRILE